MNFYEFDTEAKGVCGLLHRVWECDGGGEVSGGDMGADEREEER